MTPEEYIKAYTRGNSNELVGGDYHEWLTPENALAAVELAREEMMKDAIEGEVIDKGDFIKFADGKYIDLNPTMGAEPFVKFEDGDKVKVIIIKE